jgi:hypothetical protein
MKYTLRFIMFKGYKTFSSIFPLHSTPAGILGKVNLTMVEQEKATYKHCNLITSQALNN